MSKTLNPPDPEPPAPHPPSFAFPTAGFQVGLCAVVISFYQLRNKFKVFVVLDGYK
jgi:hypothetical protein